MGSGLRRYAVLCAGTTLGAVAVGAVGACVGDDPDSNSSGGADANVAPETSVDAGVDAPSPDGATDFCTGATVCERFDEDSEPVPFGWQKSESGGGAVLLVASDVSKPSALQSRLPVGDGGEQEARVHRIFSTGGGAFDLRIEIQIRVNVRADPLAPAVPLVFIALSQTSFFNIAATGRDKVAAAVVKEKDGGGVDIVPVASDFAMTPNTWHRFVAKITQGATGSATAQVTFDGNALVPGDSLPVDVGPIAGPDLNLRIGAYVPSGAGAVEVAYDDLRVDLK